MLGTVASAATIGSENFDYSDGSLAGRSGGNGFDFDNFSIVQNPASHDQTPSHWRPVRGQSEILGQQLSTNSSSVLRSYNGPTTGSFPFEGPDISGERRGAIANDPFYAENSIYYSVVVTFTPTSQSFSVSSYDFDSEEVFFGVEEGGSTLSIRDSSGTETTTSFSPVEGVPFNLVVKIDLGNDLLSMWVDPDLSALETNTSNLPLATQPYFNDNFSTGVALSSLGSVLWDDLLLATSWSELAEPDSDGDLLPNWWEEAYGSDPIRSDGSEDSDLDALSNLAEYQNFTFPQEVDSDGDLLSDSAEVLTHLTLPYEVDSDQDGLSDGEEILALMTDPLLRDTDSDGSPDLIETSLQSDPQNPLEQPLNLFSLSAADQLQVTNNSPVTVFGPAELDSVFAQQIDEDFTGSVLIEMNLEWIALANETGLQGWGGVQLFNGEDELLTLGNLYPTTEWTLATQESEQALLDSDFLPVALQANQAEKLSLLLVFRAHEPATAHVFFRGGHNSVTGDFAFDRVLVNAGSTQPANFTDILLTPEVPVANADVDNLRHLQTARVRPLLNDTGGLLPSSLTILTQPNFGTASAASDGSVTYTHTTGLPISDSFQYQASRGPFSVTGTFTFNFSTEGRFATQYATLPLAAPATSISIIDAFDGLSFDRPHCFTSIPNDNRAILLTEAAGLVKAIENVSSPTSEVILDITDRVFDDGNELALKGIAVHPAFAFNGYLYLTYDAVGSSRVSRFTCNTTPPYTADPASELILIDQVRDGLVHSIGTCQFGADGYLYIGFGDEGGQEDGFGNSQQIDRDFWTNIIRIDPDKNAGNLEPNPDSDIPRDNGSARFLIPADNPFVGVSSFNGQALNPLAVRSEIFCTGLRNPWQFFLDDFDSDNVIEQIWLGDIGRADREEVSLLSPGENGGWAWREGSIAGPLSGDLINGASESEATLTSSLYDYERGSGPNNGSAVIGGLVYRGDNYGDLLGQYVFADFISGNIWSLDNSDPANIEVRRLAGEAGITAIGLDPSNNDILFLDRNDGKFHRLAFGSEDVTFPQTLSDTNFFADLATLTPNPGAVAYTPNLTFWSDHAKKERFFLIQDLSDTVSYLENEPWSFPEGMIWVKHFNIELTRGDPSTSRRLETRFLVRTDAGVYGTSYQWNNITNGGPQTEATLVPDEGALIPLPILEDGNAITQDWMIPSRSSCLICHTENAGYALSFNSPQLNTNGSVLGENGNLLSVLTETGYLTGLSESPASLPRHVQPTDSDYSLTARARSYLAVNCSYCHFEGGQGLGDWDARIHLTLHETGLINGVPSDAPIQAGDLLVTPGSADNSIIYNRAAVTNGYTRMPPLASNVVDPEGTQLLLDWINREAPTTTSYEQFRELHFGNLTSLAGDPLQDPDGDGKNNRFEYFTRTDPNDPQSVWTPLFEIEGQNVELSYQPLPDRTIIGYHSFDLETWIPFSTDPTPRNPASLHFETIPLEAKAFFQFGISEK